MYVQCSAALVPVGVCNAAWVAATQKEGGERKGPRTFLVRPFVLRDFLFGFSRILGLTLTVIQGNESLPIRRY